MIKTSSHIEHNGKSLSIGGTVSLMLPVNSIGRHPCSDVPMERSSVRLATVPKL